MTFMNQISEMLILPFYTFTEDKQRVNEQVESAAEDVVSMMPLFVVLKSPCARPPSISPLPPALSLPLSLLLSHTHRILCHGVFQQCYSHQL